MVPSLEAALGIFYRDHVLGGLPLHIAATDLKTALADPDVRAQATARLAELVALDRETGGNLAKRCFVSHIQKLGLQGALND